MAKQKEMMTCPRCDGEGRIPEHTYILDGICFKCNGSGKVAKPVVRKPSKAQEAKKQAKERAREIEQAEYQVRMNLAQVDSRVSYIMAKRRPDITPAHDWYKIHRFEWYNRLKWDGQVAEIHCASVNWWVE